MYLYLSIGKRDLLSCLLFSKPLACKVSQATVKFQCATGYVSKGQESKVIVKAQEEGRMWNVAIINNKYIGKKL